jgi:hypothetical protein
VLYFLCFYCIKFLIAALGQRIIIFMVLVQIIFPKSSLRGIYRPGQAVRRLINEAHRVSGGRILRTTPAPPHKSTQDSSLRDLIYPPGAANIYTHFVDAAESVISTANSFACLYMAGQ